MAHEDRSDEVTIDSLTDGMRDALVIILRAHERHERDPRRRQRGAHTSSSTGGRAVATSTARALERRGLAEVGILSRQVWGTEVGLAMARAILDDRMRAAAGDPRGDS